MHYLLIYQAGSDYTQQRERFRAEHLSLAWEAVARGELLLGGALGDPAHGAVLLFNGPSPAAAIAFAEHDPYVRNGLVSEWTVEPWQTVVGTMQDGSFQPVSRVLPSNPT
jgi:uncharacterized protein YciI